MWWPYLAFAVGMMREAWNGPIMEGTCDLSRSRRRHCPSITGRRRPTTKLLYNACVASSIVERRRGASGTPPRRSRHGNGDRDATGVLRIHTYAFVRSLPTNPL